MHFKTHFHRVYVDSPYLKLFYTKGCLTVYGILISVLQDPSELRCPLVPLVQTSRLVGRLIEILPENHAQYSLALHLLEAVEALTTED